VRLGSLLRSESSWLPHPDEGCAIHRWDMVATNDEAIPPDAERQFAER
jgi:hypothetical protein